MNATATDRLLALAGVFQAVTLVDQIAHRGRANVDAAALTASINSLFQTDPDNVAAVYGDAGGVRVGLHAVMDHLGRRGMDAQHPIAYYTACILFLEGRIHRSAVLTQKLTEGVRAAIAKVPMFGADGAPTLAHLSEVYQQTAGQAGPRIVVRGDPEQIKAMGTADLIRSLLLAAIRSAWLWRQCGGSRLTLLLQSRRLRDSARELLGALETA